MSITFTASHNTTHPKFGDVISAFPGSPELNVANGNAVHIFKTLQMQWEHEVHGGQIDAGELLDKLDAAIPELCERLPSDEKKPGQCRVIDFGISADQADRYFKTLQEIAFFAMEHGCFVSWI